MVAEAEVHALVYRDWTDDSEVIYIDMPATRRVTQPVDISDTGRSKYCEGKYPRFCLDYE